MRSPVARVVVLSLLATLAACTMTPAPRHYSQAAPGVDFSRFSTFSLAAAGDAAGTEAPMPMLDVNIRNAVIAEMTRRGYREDDAAPDLRIYYETAAKDMVRSSPVRLGIGMGSWGGNVGGSVGVSSASVQSYQEGQLIIHVADAAANQEIWSGTVSGKVDRGSLDADSIARAVALAMEGFPARAGTLPSGAG